MVGTNEAFFKMNCRVERSSAAPEMALPALTKARLELVLVLDLGDASMKSASAPLLVTRANSEGKQNIKFRIFFGNKT